MRLSYRSLAVWISAAATTTSATSATCTSPGFVGAHRSATAFINRQRLFGGARNSSTTIRRMASTTTTTSSSDNNNNKLRVALCQFHVTPDKERNHATARDYIDRAVAQGATLIILPEIWNSPYATSAFPEYAEVLPQLGDTEVANQASSPSSALLMERAKHHQVWIVGGSIPEKVVVEEEVDADDDGNNNNNNVYNTCLVYAPNGTVVAKHRKVHLFDISVPGGITFRESDTLSPGNSLTSFAMTENLDVGIGICYDIRFPLQAMVMCQNNPNCKLLIFPGAFNMTTGPAHWELLQRARALDNQCFVITVSPARTTPPPPSAPSSEQQQEKGNTKYPQYTAWGHSTCVDPWGTVIAKADEKEALIVCDLELNRVEEVRTSIPIRKQQRTDLYKLEDVSTS
jgi:omega-amidase